MVRFQNRRNRTRWTSDVFWIMRSAIGTLPGLARTTVGHNTAPDHPVEARLLQLHCRDAREMFIKMIKTILKNNHFHFCKLLLTKVVFAVFYLYLSFFFIALILTTRGSAQSYLSLVSHPLVNCRVFLLNNSDVLI